jgi:ubiquinone/menaquinone biosynthesis C-methylase UbiE
MPAALSTRIISRLTLNAPDIRSSLWKQLYQILSRFYKNPDWIFMNYGYASIDEHVDAIVLKKEDEPNRYTIQLYERVLHSIDLSGLSVLEIGSGRGGGCSYLMRYKRPKTMLGIDYSDTAVRLSRKLHAGTGATFETGDAAALPCSDNYFDIVINVESSHCYAAIDRFVSEVHRVLKPGGRFVWTDFRSAKEMDDTIHRLTLSGLVLVEQTSITANVVQALDLVNEQKERAIRRYVPRPFRNSFRDFAGIKGSRVYEALASRQVEYYRCVLEKPRHCVITRSSSN